MQTVIKAGPEAGAGLQTPRRPSSVCMLEASPESSRTCVIPVNPSGVEINLKHRALLFNQREPCLTKKYCVQAKVVFLGKLPFLPY